MFKDSKALEYTCYSIGAGAFGIFTRWMQLMLARNEEGLFEKSFWNVAVLGLLILASIFFIRFISQYKKKNMYVPSIFYRAYKNNEKYFRIVSWFSAVMMIAGGMLLIMKSDADKNFTFLAVLAVLGILSGLSFPLILRCANRPHNNNLGIVTFLSFIPILFFAFWLITCYKQNSISSIGWSFIVELITASVSMLAFFRVAGFAYGVPNWPKAMFFSMLASSCCIMSLSDERYIGQQIMLVGSATMLLTYNWLMITNMKTRHRTSEASDELDFDYIAYKENKKRM